jgi:hypothetical protein
MQTTFLKHTLPDGSSHIDWLIDIAPGSPDRVPTFRLEARPDLAPPTAFAALRLPDHRRMYLDYAGPVSGNRGRVEPVQTGEVRAVCGWPDALDIAVALGEPRHAWRWRGTPIAGQSWHFDVLAHPFD